MPRKPPCLVKRIGRIADHAVGQLKMVSVACHVRSIQSFFDDNLVHTQHPCQAEIDKRYTPTRRKHEAVCVRDNGSNPVLWDAAAQHHNMAPKDIDVNKYRVKF